MGNMDFKYKRKNSSAEEKREFLSLEAIPSTGSTS
jgi:hypothetical protein